MRSDCIRVFKAFCEPKRLEILELLKSKEQCACTLLEKLNLTQSGLSYHMRILTNSGIVQGRQEGKWVYYSLSRDGKEKAIQMIEELTTPNSYEKTCCND